MDKNIKHNIDIVVDRLVVKPGIEKRLTDSLENVFELTEGNAIVDVVDGEPMNFSQNFACPDCGISVDEVEPRSFSFNNPFGACPVCYGLGYKMEFDVNTSEVPFVDTMEISLKDPQTLHIKVYEKGIMVKEMNCSISLNQPLELLLGDFSTRSGNMDIASFSEVFSFAKRSGGNFVTIIDATSRHMRVRGEFIPVGRLRKNEIAVCDLVLQEEIVIDAFAKHKTLGELILIDRISNMTSACGVVENPTLDETKDLKCAFAHGNLKANGDIFEEYYYDLEAMNVFKVQPSDKTYTIGDVIPVKGETYQYPDSFDVVVLREQVAVSIRDQKVTAIIPLADFAYNDVPVINGRGFAVHVTSAADVDAFKKELSAEGSEISENFFNKWVDFETYRRIVFKDEHWTE